MGACERNAHAAHDGDATYNGSYEHVGPILRLAMRLSVLASRSNRCASAQ
jgi:hypothetical protein